MTTVESDRTSAALAERHAALVAGGEKIRIRERAARLGVSEAALVDAGLGVASIRLEPGPQALFEQLPTLGRVMALTRNDACVHERHGRFEDVQVGPSPVGLVTGPDIDLRLFFSCWKYAWAVSENGRDSIQFFDGAGQALHKIYRTDETDAAAWQAFIDFFRTDGGGEPVAAPAFDDLAATRRAQAAVPDGFSDQVRDDGQRAALRDAWLALRDTHDFFPMLRKLKLTRRAALAGVGDDLSQPVPTAVVEAMLTEAAERGVPIMCFVGNPGIIQIHSGPVKRLMRTGPWFNVLDPTFNLHLDTTAIDRVFIVQKPSVDGWITSLEALAADGSMIVQFFGERKPGKPELPAWRALVAGHAARPLKA